MDCCDGVPVLSTPADSTEMALRTSSTVSVGPEGVPTTGSSHDSPVGPPVRLRD